MLWHAVLSIRWMRVNVQSQTSEVKTQQQQRSGSALHSHQNVVDRNVNDFNEESYEPHDDHSHAG